MAKKKDDSKGGGISAAMRALIFLGLAVIAGGAATIMVWQMVTSYKMQIEEAHKPEETVMVIVAAGDLFPGVSIAEGDIVGVEVPKKYVPTDAFTSPELVVGRIPRERILANEFVRPSRLADGETGVGLNALVPPGMRAISLNINDGAAVSGFLEPGNRVDLVVTMANDKGERQTITLMQTVPVLAVNGRMLHDDPTAQPPDPNDPNAKPKRPAPKGAPSITFAVTPEQAEIIAHVSRLGQITLTLRSDKDLDAVPTTPVDLLALLPPEMRERALHPPAPPPSVKKKAAPPPPPPPEGIKIIRGGSTTVTTPPPQGN
jgi:pilus assembly protein CpaB